MIKIAELQFYPWDNIYHFYFTDQLIKTGDQIIAQTEFGQEFGQVFGIKEENESNYQLVEVSELNSNDKQLYQELETTDETVNQKQKLWPIIRVADADDLNVFQINNQKKAEMLFEAERIVKKSGLPMKLVDAGLSIDNNRAIFAFIADGRVDFRDLVKELSRYFRKLVRLQQLGARDEAKVKGDLGHCGRQLCCKGHLKNLGGVNSELINNQQLGYRGADRLSGACGRLMCCLSYENNGYVELMKTLPKIGEKIHTLKGFGMVVGWHTLKQTIDVQMGEDRSSVIEVELNEVKK